MKEKQFAQKHPYFTIAVSVVAMIVLLAAVTTFKTAYNSDKECESDCIEKGYETGDCLWPTESKSNYKNIGNCEIKGDERCESLGQCNCYCLDKEGQKGAIKTGKKLCEEEGGTWKQMPNACADSCRAQRENLMCAQVLTHGCDCGEGMCWNGESCEKI